MDLLHTPNLAQITKTDDVTHRDTRSIQNSVYYIIQLSEANKADFPY